MRSYGSHEGGPAGGAPNLPEHEALAIEAVGSVIEFWGFKRNQGRLWALLYLRGRAYTAGELIAELDLSKGAVSMLTRELESWGVLGRVREAGESAWRFQAETDLLQMIGRVVQQREAGMIKRAHDDLEEAWVLAKQDPTLPSEERARLERMRTLAGLVEKAVKLFLTTARLDVKDALTSLNKNDRSRQ
jgi:HTH-type transcriptional regulator, glycine betaine synthesis regulator